MKRRNKRLKLVSREKGAQSNGVKKIKSEAEKKIPTDGVQAGRKHANRSPSQAPSTLQGNGKTGGQ